MHEHKHVPPSPDALRSIFETLGESITAQAVLKHEALRSDVLLHS